MQNNLKITLLTLGFLALTSCTSTGNNKQEIIKVKITDKSTYSYTPNNAPPSNPQAEETLTNQTKTNNSDWLAPVDASIKTKYTEKNKTSIFDTTKGMNVIAINDGKVVYSSGNLKSFGNMIIIKHQYGFYSHYMFTDKLLTKVGDAVTQGDVIATTSNKPFALQLKKYTTIINSENYISIKK